MNKNRNRYAVYGFFFGLLFPTLGTLVVCYNEEMQVNFSNLIRVQQLNSLLWIIDTAPLFLGLFASFAGQQLDKLAQTNEELSKRYQEMKKLRVEADAANQAKSNFIAKMSHEIRTPMHAVLGLAKIVSKSNLSSTNHEMVRQILSSGRYLQSLINNILDFSKISAEEFELLDAPFSLSKLIAEIERILTSMATEKGLNLTMELGPGIEEEHIGDELRIKQVLLNVLGNAIKFTPSGFVSLQVVQTGKSTTHQTVQMTIRDSGIGMSKEFAGSIFSRFSQEDAQNNRKFEGSGLGMAITAELIQRMKGRITVDSIKGSGSTFTISLPLEIHRTETNIRKDKSAQVDDFKGLMVLLVEDNPVNALVAKTTLSFHGIHVVEARNGLEAIEHNALDEVDLILMDFQMPVMDGFEATEKLRKEKGVTVPIIALTANAIKTDIEKCFELGMNDYLLKPFSEEQLMRVLAKNTHKKIGRRNTVELKSKPLVQRSYNTSVLEAYKAKSVDFYKQLLEIFIREVPSILKELSTHFEQSNFKELKKTAHKLKPVFLQYGISSLEEEIALLNTFEEENEEQVQKVVVAFNKIRQITKVILLDFEQMLQEVS